MFEVKRQPRVLNIRTATEAEKKSAIYCGRGSDYGNDFVIGKDGTRDEVCDKFANKALQNKAFLAKIRKELRGRDLLCFCKPKRCHCDFLLKVANG